MSEEAKTRQLLIGLGCVIHNSHVLLVQRYEPEQVDLNLTWELPGGKVKLSETPEDAVVREVWEETGYEIKVDDPRPFGYVTPYWQYGSSKQRAILLCYQCCLLSGRPTAQRTDPKIQLVKWVEFSEIDLTHVISGSRELIQWIVEDREKNLDNHFRKGTSAYISFENIEPETATQKFYNIRLEVDPALLQPYNLYRTWGRIGRKHYRIWESYDTDLQLRRRLLELVNQRITHGYSITKVSDNFPLRDWLYNHPIADSHTAVQLTLPQIELNE